MKYLIYRALPIALAVLSAASSANAAPISILFVGNSYTFGRADGSLNPDGTLNLTNQVLTYNSANVRDLSAPRGPNLVVGGTNASTPKFTDLTGTNSYPIDVNNPSGVQGNSYSPHTQANSWGGTAGIFKQFTVQAGLDYDVALSTRNAASLRGHLLNTANSNWDLRSNISSQQWGNIVLQDQSDEALAPKTVTTDFTGRPLLAGTSGVLGSNFPSVRAYVDLIEDWVHTGKVTIAQGLAAVTSFTEREMFRAQYRPSGGNNAAADAACAAAGGGTFCTNGTTRDLGENLNKNSETKIYLQETWARPDLINSPGAKTLNPVTALATYDANTPAPSYFGSLEEMTEQLRLAMLNVRDYADDDGTSGIKGVIPTGQAFLRAVQDGVATRDMYAANAGTDDLIDLWFNDGTHPSKWGSYLSALTVFGSVTGLDPQSLGYHEWSARDLGISGEDAYTLQQIAAARLGFQKVPEPGSLALVLTGVGVLGFMARRRKLSADNQIN